MPGLLALDDDAFQEIHESGPLRGRAVLPVVETVDTDDRINRGDRGREYDSAYGCVRVVAALSAWARKRCASGSARPRSMPASATG